MTGSGSPAAAGTERRDREAAAYALVALPGMSAARLARLLAAWPDPREAARAVQAGRAWRAVELPSSDARAVTASWARALDVAAARSVLDARGTRVLLGTDADFPVPEGVPGRPAVLLAEGEHPEVLGPVARVAVVGTRAATPHGLADARELGAVLAAEGVAVVSGMAIGIDGAAHEGALDAGGSAVGVVATGLDVVYPRRHAALHRRVRAAGALVSEVPLRTRPDRSRFPIRNRIIAGLAHVVVVVEATAHGGARITAEYAMDGGVTVLAVPGSRRNAAAAGCNALIADGAIPLLEPSDVLVALGMTEPGGRSWGAPAREPPGDDAAAVLQALGGEPATTDQLASRTGLGPGRVAVAVAWLSREGWVEVARGLVWPR